MEWLSRAWRGVKGLFTAGERAALLHERDTAQGRVRELERERDELRQEVARLQDRLDFSETLEHEVYWTFDEDGRRKDPWCPICFGKHHHRIPLRRVNHILLCQNCRFNTDDPDNPRPPEPDAPRRPRRPGGRWLDQW